MYKPILGQDKINLKGLNNINGEHRLMMLVYSLKRSMNIFGMPELIERLKNWSSEFKERTYFCLKWTHLKPLRLKVNFLIRAAY